MRRIEGEEDKPIWLPHHLTHLLKLQTQPLLLQEKEKEKEKESPRMEEKEKRELYVRII